jgi:Nuclear transport factor 2 (NTF2) domain
MEGKAPWQLLGEEFVKQYYNIFDTNREQLPVLYAVGLFAVA